MWNGRCLYRGWGWGNISFPSPPFWFVQCGGYLLGGWGKTSKCVSIPLTPIHTETSQKSPNGNP